MGANQEIIAELRRVLNERDEARRERDEARAERDNLLDTRSEGAWMARALDAERMAAEAEKLSDAAKAAWDAECIMREQRDRFHAEWKQERQEVERLRAEAASSLAMARIADEKHGWKCAEVDVLRGVGCSEDGDGPCGVCRKCSYRRGAEAMREACARAALRSFDEDDPIIHELRALPTPEEP